jgi:hypothetical protein
MRITRSDLAACRAVIAVAALYALALQSVLGGLIGYRSMDPAHSLCLPEARLQEAGTAEEPAQPVVPIHRHLACCTAAQAVAPLAAPLLVATAILWPVRPARTIVWPPEIAAAPRAPPGISASARAPPVV